MLPIELNLFERTYRLANIGVEGNETARHWGECRGVELRKGAGSGKGAVVPMRRRSHV